VKKPRLHVTDHAMLRWIERVHGVDVETLRRQLGHRLDAVCERHEGMSAVLVDGFRFVIERDTTVVTVLRTERAPKGRGVRRKRERDE